MGLSSPGPSVYGCHPMTNALPPALESALQSLIHGTPLGPLSFRAQAISKAYRAGSGSKAAVQTGQDVLAYALTRMPATFAAIDDVLDQALLAWPEFSPKTILDLGTGPGTGAWACASRWPELDQIVLLDRHGPFQEFAKKLLAIAPFTSLTQAKQVVQDLAQPGPALAPADLVLAAYVLAELEQAAIYSIIRQAMGAARGLLVVIEPGTPQGYQRLMIARQTLIDMGARILAPCPHQHACLIVAPDWCRFAARLQRSRSHRTTKGVEAAFEDEPYAYLVATLADGGSPKPARIIGPPSRSKIGIALKLCQDQKIETVTIPSRDRTASAHARRLKWGDGYDGPRT